MTTHEAELEEVLLQEESVSSHQPISVKKNNFFSEEEICSTTAVMPFEKEPELKGKKGKTRRPKNKQALQEHSCDEETVRA